MPSDHIHLDARPAPIDIDFARTAVIVVDMQNDFGSEGGMFARMGLDITGIQAATAQCARVLQPARSAGARIVYLKMGYRPDLSDAGWEGAPNRVRNDRMGVGHAAPTPEGEGRILVRGEWGTRIVDRLAPQPGDVEVWKHRFSGFFETELDQLLRSWGIRQLLVVGCTTSICVESTVRDAFFRDYQTVVLEDCTAEPLGSSKSRTNHEATLHLIETALGWVSDSGQFLAALETADTGSVAA